MQNLYDRIERMQRFGPEFIDVTWGAGGSSADLTTEMVANAQAVYGLETMMHLTCTNMPVEKIDQALKVTRIYPLVAWIRDLINKLGCQRLWMSKYLGSSW